MPHSIRVIFLLQQTSEMLTFLTFLVKAHFPYLARHHQCLCFTVCYQHYQLDSFPFPLSNLQRCLPCPCFTSLRGHKQCVFSWTISCVHGWVLTIPVCSCPVDNADGIPSFTPDHCNSTIWKHQTSKPRTPNASDLQGHSAPGVLDFYTSTRVIETLFPKDVEISNDSFQSIKLHQRPKCPNCTGNLVAIGSLFSHQHL